MDTKRNLSKVSKSLKKNLEGKKRKPTKWSQKYKSLTENEK